jgi:hypothetical protein
LDAVKVTVPDMSGVDTPYIDVTFEIFAHRLKTINRLFPFQCAYSKKGIDICIITRI